MLQRFRHWLKFNRAYINRPPWDTQISPPELLAYIAEHAPGRALDLGCGTGTNVITLAKHGWQVTGIDFVPSAILQARRKSREENVACAFQVGDAAHLAPSLDGQDLILDIGCFHGLSASQRQAYVDSVRRALNPDGNWLVYMHLFAAVEEGRSGVTEADLARLSGQFELIRREDGRDVGRNRASAWLLYKAHAAETVSTPE